jgi:hypothetical protein
MALVVALTADCDEIFRSLCTFPTIRSVVNFKALAGAAVLAEGASSVESNLATLFPPLRRQVAPIFTLTLPSRLDPA